MAQGKWFGAICFGGIQMKPFLLLTACVCLMSSGCLRQQCRDGGTSCHVMRSQVAPRPSICRTSCNGSSGLRGLMNGRLLGRRGGCGDGCADCGSGCSIGRAFGGGETCGDCGKGCCICEMAGRAAGAVRGLNPHSGGYPEMPTYNPGPPVGQVAYPYYTVRGPRDFLRDNPPSIGPY